MSAWPDADRQSDDAVPDEKLLRQRVAGLKPGDKVRCVFMDAEESLVAEGRLHSHPGIEKILYVGNSRIPEIQITDGCNKPLPFLVSVAILEPAPVPFYTNHPADRKPRIGDVARHDTSGGNLVVFVRDGWVHAPEDPRPYNRIDRHQFDAGELALVDPSELEESP